MAQLGFQAKKFAVGWGAAGENDPRRQRSSVGAFAEPCFQPVARQAHDILKGMGRSRVYFHSMPANGVDEQALDGRLAVFDRNQQRPARSGLANVAPLEIARECDQRTLTENFVFMNMAQGPVVVSLAGEVRQ